MSTSVAAPGAVDPADRPAHVRTLADQMPRFMRLVHALKSQATKNDARDRAALVLLFPLVRMGPLRQSALADLVHADPSTVSRHVASLVEQGLVHRVADESDGRASRLVVTDPGQDAVQALCRERENHLAQVTSDWDVADLATFTTLFGRLLDDIAACLPGVSEGTTSDGTTPTDLPRERR
jgi:DNA-binding MarR family transcriptional regulator